MPVDSKSIPVTENPEGIHDSTVIAVGVLSGKYRLPVDLEERQRIAWELVSAEYPPSTPTTSTPWSSSRTAMTWQETWGSSRRGPRSGH